MSNEFEMEFESNKEAIEAADAVISEIVEAIEADEKTATERNKVMENRVRVVYSIMKRVMIGEGLKFGYELHKPYESMGSVTITGESMEVADTILFARAAEIASNFEVYTTTDGKVQWDFTFHNLTKKTKE